MAERHLRAVGDDERGPKRPPKCSRCGGSRVIVSTWFNPDTGVLEEKTRRCPQC